MSTIDELAATILSNLLQDEHFAREACGGTVVGEAGNWRQAPGGDEWEACESEYGDEQLLVALRPGLPRPPDVMGGYWGAVVAEREDERERGVVSPMPAFRHMARHDPHRVLRDVASKRALLEQLLAEPHVRTPWLCESEAGDPCDCGRDARVAGYLTLLAQAWQEGLE